MGRGVRHKCGRRYYSTYYVSSDNTEIINQQCIRVRSCIRDLEYIKIITTTSPILVCTVTKPVRRHACTQAAEAGRPDKTGFPQSRPDRQPPARNLIFGGRAHIPNSDLLKTSRLSRSCIPSVRYHASSLFSTSNRQGILGPPPSVHPNHTSLDPVHPPAATRQRT